MHPPGKTGAIPGLTQIMRESRHRGGKITGVVISAKAADQLAGHEGGTRRGAERRIAIGGIKTRAARRQRVEIGSFDNAMAIGTGEMRRQLVCHDQDDVRAGW